jgi:hypothetical protein
MPRHFGIRKRKELKGGAVSNVNQLAEDFAKELQLGKSDDVKMDSQAIKKKFSI